MNSPRIASMAFAVAVLTAPAAFAQGSTTPSPSTPPATESSPPAASPTVQTPGAGMQTSKPSAAALLGRDVFSSDQTRLGKVERVVSGSQNDAQAILIKTGGFLGFGGKTVSIPASRFSMRGDAIQLQMTADEVSKLPESKDQG